MQSFQKFLTQTLGEVVELQQLFDRAYENELLQLSPLIQQLPDLDPLIIAGLVPSRLSVHQYEFKCRLQMEQDRMKQHSFVVKHIPLKFDLLLEEKIRQEQHIHLFVKQVPLDTNPFSNT